MIGDSNSDGLNVYGHFSTEDHFFSDGVSDDITFPKKLSKADRDKLESIFFEEGTDGLEIWDGSKWIASFIFWEIKY